MPLEHGAALDYMRKIKKTFDPNGASEASYYITEK
jgi:FAD/FMN-containing dehydrogenase